MILLRYPRSNSGEEYGDLISHSRREHVDVTLHVFPVQRKAGEGLTHVKSQFFNSLRSPAGFETHPFLSFPFPRPFGESTRLSFRSHFPRLFSRTPSLPVTPTSDILSRFLFNSPSLLSFSFFPSYTTLTNFIRGRSRDSART